MLRLVIFGCLLACCLAAAPRLFRPRFYGRVVGGKDADIENFPYQLSFEYYESHRCGASIISEDWVVTAAHCTDGISAENVRLRAGSSILGKDGSIHNAEKIITNPNYDYYTIDFDIAVIKVSSPFVLGTGVQPIPLAESAPSTGLAAIVTGWGATSEGSWGLPSQLQQVELPVVDHADCNKSYKQYGGVTDNMICAGYPDGGKDACQGDSGGPLAAEGKLIGVVSWGLGCARKGFPGVYTNVAVLRSWVKENSGV